VVVVPTIALALDQARRMRSLLEWRYPERPWTSLAYHGGLEDAEKKGHWCWAIREGRQGIVFASPESVASGLSVGLEAAVQCGFLRYLIC